MRDAWWVIGAVAALTAAGLAVVVRTRWLQSHTLAKCVLLSVALHVVLAMACALLAGFAPASWGRDDEGRMTMVMVVADGGSEESDAAVEPQPAETTAPPLPASSPARETDAFAVSSAGVPDDVVPLLAAPTAAVDTEGEVGPPPRSIPAVHADRSASRRAVAAAARGGSAATERAVGMALEWLAANQADDGRWDAARHGAGRGRQQHGQQASGVRSDHGVTGLALLAFLGAGSTPGGGPYAESVSQGIRFLVDHQRADGSLAGDAEFFAALYCHGMAGIALAECMALTGDPSLREPLERAVAHTLAMQHPATGGWRYAAGDKGDTSQLGWQVMLLESAAQAGIDAVPGSGIDQARRRARAFLQSVSSGRAGGLAAYRQGERPTMPMTAEALVCRLFLGVPADHPEVGEALAFVARTPPDRSRPNAYAWYYATLASFHVGGPQWDEWNTRLQAAVVPLQRQEAGGLQGSWDPDPIWGGHGGRVYATAMAAMMLEVYYRHLPLHLREKRVAAVR